MITFEQILIGFDEIHAWLRIKIIPLKKADHTI